MDGQTVHTTVLSSYVPAAAASLLGLSNAGEGESGDNYMGSPC